MNLEKLYLQQIREFLNGIEQGSSEIELSVIRARIKVTLESIKKLNETNKNNSNSTGESNPTSNGEN